MTNNENFGPQNIGTMHGFSSGGRKTTKCNPNHGGYSIDDQIRIASMNRSSTDYHPVDKQNITGGSMNRSSSKPWVDPLKNNPDPGHILGPGELPLPEGGRMQPQVEPSSFDFNLLGDLSPGPGTHGLLELQKDHELGKFGKAERSPEFIDEHIRATADVPGPGQYNPERTHDYLTPFLPNGGKEICGQLKPKQCTFEEMANSKTDWSVDCTKYAEPGTIGSHMGVGRPPFKYYSTTMEETKHLVCRALNMVPGQSPAPGPGTYNLPQLARGRSFTLTGRTLAHSMPPPYNYNAQPDLSKKFVPIRESNSGDLIFGRCFGSDQPGLIMRKAGASTLTKEKLPQDSRTDTRDSCSKYTITNIPARSTHTHTTISRVKTPSDYSSDGDEVDRTSKNQEWVGRGFSYVLNHSESAPELNRVGFPINKKYKPAELPIESHRFVKTANTYHRLSGYMGQPSPIFLPMASRRMMKLGAKKDEETYKNFLLNGRCVKEKAKELSQALDETVLPLDKQKLYRDVTKLLRQKGAAQLRINGVKDDMRVDVLNDTCSQLKLFLGLVDEPPSPTTPVYDHYDSRGFHAQPVF